MKNTIRLIILTLSLISVFLLSSCSLLQPVKPLPITKYELNTLPQLPRSHRHALTLLILQPATKPLYNTTQMMYSDHRFQIAAFALSEWAKTPAQMLQFLIVEAMVRTHYFNAVVTPPFANYNYAISTRIFELRQDYTLNSAILHLKVQAQIIRAGDQRIISSKMITVNEPIFQRTPSGGVAAANWATAKMLQKLSVFTIATLHRRH